jgi:hypothetical protein
VVWSISQLEGTLQTPKLVLKPATDAAWLTRLRDDLTDIRKRRWDGRARPDHQTSVIVMVDPSVASGDLVNTIAAVRVDAKGEALFPDVRLATGFDTPELADAAVKKPDLPLPPPPPKGDDTRRPDQAVALQEEAAAMAMALALVGEDDSASGDMSARRPGADLDSQLASVRESGSQVVVGGGTGRGARGDGDPRVATGSGPSIDGPGAGSASGASTPSGRISVSAKSAMDDTSLTVDVVLRKMVSVYMGGLKRCYRNELKKDPAMRGAVTMSLTVNEAGRTVNANSSGFAADLDACFEGLMANWVFAVPKDADGEAVEASFQLKLQLAPD